MSDAWDAFVASLNPQALERERMRPPVADLERPGSPEDIRARRWHDEHRRRFQWVLALNDMHAQKGLRA